MCPASQWVNRAAAAAALPETKASDRAAVTSRITGEAFSPTMPSLNSWGYSSAGMPPERHGDPKLACGVADGDPQVTTRRAQQASLGRELLHGGRQDVLVVP